jgi:hypothetical protein
MASRRSIPARKLDERKYRFRVRFERLPGGGFFRGDAFALWLDERLGSKNYAFHPDTWEGHGIETYALHFDDHRIIPELLKFHATLEVINSTKARFVATVNRDQVEALGIAIPALQARLIDLLGAAGLQTIWALGRCDLVSAVTATMGDRLRLAHVNLLAMVREKLERCSAKDGALIIEDDQRGAVELGLVMLRDLRPQPAEEIKALQALTEALVEEGIRREN